MAVYILCPYSGEYKEVLGKCVSNKSVCDVEDIGGVWKNTNNLTGIRIFGTQIDDYYFALFKRVA